MNGQGSRDNVSAGVGVLASRTPQPSPLLTSEDREGRAHPCFEQIAPGLDDATFAKCCALDVSVASVCVECQETGQRSQEKALSWFDPDADFPSQIARLSGRGGWCVVYVRPNDGTQKPFQFGLRCPLVPGSGVVGSGQSGLREAFEVLLAARQILLPSQPAESQGVLSILREARLAKSELDQLTGQAPKGDSGEGLLGVIVKAAVEKVVEVLGKSALPTAAETEAAGVLPETVGGDGVSAPGT